MFYLFLRERESARVCPCTRGRGKERRGQRFQGGLRGDGREPDVGLELMNYKIMT